MTLTPEMLRKIQRIELRTRKLVNEVFAGAYHSVFKGQGIEFDSVRPYQPGDDVRSIDWNVTARSDEPYIKQYVEERELTVMLAIDMSASCFFGSQKQQKHDQAVETATVLAYSAIRNQDKVGLLLFSDKVEMYLAPRKGRNHVLRLIRELAAAKPGSKGTDIGLGLRTVNRLLKRRAVVFFISDFLENPDDYSRDIALIAQKHDVIGVVLGDPLEVKWPDAGLVTVRDAETQTLYRIDTSQTNWNEQFREQSARFRRARDKALSRAGIDRIDMQSDTHFIPALTAFFQRRAQRLKR
jgi:uncharacterized protein (DUF58 family)